MKPSTDDVMVLNLLFAALNDGVLWDVTSGKAIHKFDKFNPNISGVFHPAGLEVIINSEVGCHDVRRCLLSYHIL